MKEYSLRLDIKLTANSDLEAKNKSELIIKELPRVEDSSLSSYSVYSYNQKKIISNAGVSVK